MSFRPRFPANLDHTLLYYQCLHVYHKMSLLETVWAEQSEAIQTPLLSYMHTHEKSTLLKLTPYG